MSADALLVAVAVPRHARDDPPYYWSALFVWTAPGDVQSIVAGAERHHRLEPLMIVDLDGDAVDDYLAVWTGSAYQDVRMSGDGG
ncbi:MAG: hypothetical protein AAF721_26810 [Myxococcota bacterium]